MAEADENPIRLWHDDIRTPPDNTWIWARTNEEAKAALQMNRVVEISMDHDLGLHDLDPSEYESPDVLRGQSEQTGYDLAEWMCRTGYVPGIVTIHSWNPPGAKRMQQRFHDFGVMAEVKPFGSKAESDPLFQARAGMIAEQCRMIGELSGVPYLVENPVSVLSSLFGPADHSFHPYEFAGLEPSDNYTKKTCLWTGNGFRMPAPCPDPDLGSPDDRIHKAPPSEDRANFRSATPMGFARAVFEANALAPVTENKK